MYQLRLDVLNNKYIIAMLKYRINPVLNVDPASEEEFRVSTAIALSV